MGLQKLINVMSELLRRMRRWFLGIGVVWKEALKRNEGNARKGS